MMKVLAAIDTHPVAGRVVETAERIAEVIAHDVDIVHVRESDAGEHVVRGRFGGAMRCIHGDPANEIVRCAADPDVGFVVVGAQGRARGSRTVGHIARAVLERADRPVVVVPPTMTYTPTGLRRALLPLEGSEVTSGAVDAIAADLVGGGVDLVPLHVFDVATTPAFWDQVAHAPDSYAAAFGDRWSPSSAPVRLRRGEAGRTIVDAAEAEAVDMIVLGWAQDLAPGRARVVRTVLRDAGVPVLLVPRGTPTPA